MGQLTSGSSQDTCSILKSPQEAKTKAPVRAEPSSPQPKQPENLQLSEPPGPNRHREGLACPLACPPLLGPGLGIKVLVPGVDRHRLMTCLKVDDSKHIKVQPMARPQDPLPRCGNQAQPTGRQNPRSQEKVAKKPTAKLAPAPPKSALYLSNNLLKEGHSSCFTGLNCKLASKCTAALSLPGKEPGKPQTT